MTGAHRDPFTEPRTDPAVLAQAAREWSALMLWSAGVKFDDRDRFRLWELLNHCADFMEGTSGE